jgi:hypothetical protein
MQMGIPGVTKTSQFRTVLPAARVGYGEPTGARLFSEFPDPTIHPHNKNCLEPKEPEQRRPKGP